MIFSLRKLIERIKFMLIFIILTYFIYHLVGAVTSWIQPTDPYKQPIGRAVKVFNTTSDMNGNSVTARDRLAFFYWYGE